MLSKYSVVYDYVYIIFRAFCCGHYVYNIIIYY